MIKTKRLEIHRSMLNTQCTRRKATLYFLPAIAVKVESLVTDIVTDVLIRFPIVAQHSKGAHYFCRVVGLVVINIHYPQRTFSRIFCNNFINCLPILKILSLLDTARNCIQNRYNTSRHFLKTSLHYHVKHKT